AFHRRDQHKLDAERFATTFTVSHHRRRVHVRGRPDHPKLLIHRVLEELDDAHSQSSKTLTELLAGSSCLPATLFEQCWLGVSGCASSRWLRQCKKLGQRLACLPPAQSRAR